MEGTPSVIVPLLGIGTPHGNQPASRSWGTLPPPGFYVFQSTPKSSQSFFPRYHQQISEPSGRHSVPWTLHVPCSSQKCSPSACQPTSEQSSEQPPNSQTRSSAPGVGSDLLADGRPAVEEKGAEEGRRGQEGVFRPPHSPAPCRTRREQYRLGRVSGPSQAHGKSPS